MLADWHVAYYNGIACIVHTDRLLRLGQLLWLCLRASGIRTLLGSAAARIPIPLEETALGGVMVALAVVGAVLGFTRALVVVVVVVVLPAWVVKAGLHRPVVQRGVRAAPVNLLVRDPGTHLGFGLLVGQDGGEGARLCRVAEQVKAREDAVNGNQPCHLLVVLLERCHPQGCLCGVQEKGQGVRADC